MNLGKLYTFLRFLMLLFLIIVIYILPEKAVLFSIYLYACLIIFDLVFFTPEYFKSIRTKAILLIRTRFSFNSDTLINFFMISCLVFVIVLKFNSLGINSSEGIIFSIISFAESVLFWKQKNSVRINNDKILFDDLLINDIRLNEIKAIDFNSEKTVLRIIPVNRKEYRIKIKHDSLDSDEQLIEKVLKTIESKSRYIKGTVY